LGFYQELRGARLIIYFWTRNGIFVTARAIYGEGGWIR